MAKSCSFRVENPSGATPSAVYDTLIDVKNWTRWMPSLIDGYWERQGASETGIGGIRRTRSRLLGVKVNLREEILDGSRPQFHSYNVLSPPPGIKDYKACVVIEPRPDGCLIVWSGTFTCLAPGLGRLLQAAIRSHIARLAAALAQAAER
jgi:Polyketide cyclase / dehydrase and lipid transport